MNLRLSCALLGALCIPGSTANAQLVPTNPPTQGETNTLEKQERFAIELKHVPAALMAYWLDPKNCSAPVYAHGKSLMISPLKNFSLPAGVESIAAPTNDQTVLLVKGTHDGAMELQKIVQAIDKLVNVPVNPPIVCVSTIYWIDSLAQTAPLWAKSANLPRLAQNFELDALNGLAAQDRALSKPLPMLTLGTNSPQILPFAPSLPNWHPSNGARMYLLPVGPSNSNEVVPPTPNIDPHFQTGRKPLPPRGELTIKVQPATGQTDTVNLVIDGWGVDSAPLTVRRIVTTRYGDTVLLSGSATQFGLKPPSPRFDSFVLCITPQVSTGTLPPLTP